MLIMIIILFVVNGDGGEGDAGGMSSKHLGPVSI